jgi:hypothetical protein
MRDISSNIDIERSIILWGFGIYGDPTKNFHHAHEWVAFCLQEEPGPTLIPVLIKASGFLSRSRRRVVSVIAYEGCSVLVVLHYFLITCVRSDPTALNPLSL